MFAADQARKLAKELKAHNDEVEKILRHIRPAAEEGLFSVQVDDMSLGAEEILKDLGYKISIDTEDYDSYAVISW